MSNEELEKQLRELRNQVLELKTDLVYIMYLVERIDKNTTTSASTPPPEPPFPMEGMIVEKF